jgi:hypothetical protein
MRQIAAILVLGLLLLALPASGAGKGGGVRFCGSNGCRTTYDLTLLTQVLPVVVGREGAVVAPALPGPFFRIGFPHGDWLNAYYVPGPRLVRVEKTERVEWRRVTAAAAVFERATRRISPFPAPRLIRAEVGSRLVRRPESYLRLYDIIGRGDRVADPLGPRPALTWRNYKALVRYYRADRRLWIPIRLHSTTATPWTDASAQLSVARGHDLLRGDGIVVRIAHAAAAAVRRGGAPRN